MILASILSFQLSSNLYTAYAHGLDEMYDLVWDSGNDGNVRLYTESSLTVSMVNRIVNNAAAEIDGQGTQLNFAYMGVGTIAHSCGSGGINQNTLYMSSVDGKKDGDLARTSVCPQLDGNGAPVICQPENLPCIKKFWIDFDIAETWYTGTGIYSQGGRPRRYNPGAEYDFWSVATHELIHGTGWAVHFAESDDAFCPNGLEDSPGNPRQTMCKLVLYGGTAQRTMDVHDAHTFVKPYPVL